MGIRDEEIKDFKIGEKFYECQSGYNMEFIVLSIPVEQEGYEGRKQWSWKAKNTQSGKEIDFLLTEGLSHYGPRLYRQPEYCRIKDGEITFPLES